MSFILDGPFLIGLGFGAAGLARLTNHKFQWSLHVWSFLFLAIFYVTSVSAFVDAAWIKPVLRPPFTLGFDWTGRSGTDWMVSSGFLPFHASWPPTPTVTFVAIIAFSTYPFWIWLGTRFGYNVFGRHKGQSGLLGLMQLKVK